MKLLNMKDEINLDKYILILSHQMHLYIKIARRKELKYKIRVNSTDAQLSMNRGEFMPFFVNKSLYCSADPEL